MTNQQITDIVIALVNDMAAEWVPNPETRYKDGGSTGNMAMLGLKYKITGKTIIVYMDTNVAPYVPYTNEPWVSPKWKGKKNPNEGWWDRFAEEFIKRLSEKLGGDIKR